MADNKRMPQSKNECLTMKILSKSLLPPGDLNSDLPIQSQVCLPLDQGFMKIAKKMKNF